MADKAIHTRGLTSFFTLFGFLIMSITGLVLYVEPAGRVAYWTDWQLLNLTKMAWGNIHILSSLLFIVAGAFHTYFNWTPLMNYFKSKARQGMKLRRELIISSVLSVVIVIASIWPFPPFSYLLDFNQWIKTVWVVEDDYEPPFGHAELMSLKSFTAKMDIDLGRAEEELRANDIIFDNADQTLEEIAAENNISPMNLYMLFKHLEPAPEPEKLSSHTPESIEVEFSGTGIGNKSVASICEKLGLSEVTAAARLEAAGMSSDTTKTLREIAKMADTDPIEVMKVLLLDNYQPQPSSN